MNKPGSKFISHTLFFLNCLLLFLVIFEDRLELPLLLRFSGRWHPLLLHFPVVLLTLYGLIIMWGPVRKTAEITAFADMLLTIGAATAIFSAFSGFFLSLEDSYDPASLKWHKFTGLITSWLAFLCHAFRHRLIPGSLTARLTGAALFLTTALAGHLGAVITHGEYFLMEPAGSGGDGKLLQPEEAVVFDDLVRPVFDRKCTGCHNPEKAKGGLDMTSVQGLKKGGKNGQLWDTAHAGTSHLIRRILLPAEAKKHMPPKGRPQLTTGEIALLSEWIKHGADFSVRAHALPPGHPLGQAAREFLQLPAQQEVYDFPEVSDRKIQALNTDYRAVRRVAANSPALSVSFYSRNSFKSRDLDELTDIGQQIVSLDLSKMPVTDQDVPKLARFKNLRKLVLNFTDISGRSIPHLIQLQALRTLSLSGTGIKPAELSQLRDLPGLQTLYAWNLPSSPQDKTVLNDLLPGVNVETGFRGDTIRIALNPPAIENENPVFTGSTRVRVRHPVPGAMLRYTLDGTIPDSTASPLFDDKLVLTANTLVKVRAFKPGWLPSQVSEKAFFRTTYLPDSIILLTPASGKYPAEGAASLADGIKSDLNLRSKKWLGYLDDDLVSLMHFKKSVTIQRIDVSYLLLIRSSIFPPASVEIWGGKEPGRLKKLGRSSLPLPEKTAPDGAENRMVHLSFAPEEIHFLKLIVRRFPKLPPWHPGAGKKPWVFVDEVFIN